MTEVDVEYCVPCGFRRRALDTAAAILNACEREIDSLTLTTGDHGVFRVTVDGRTVYDKEADDMDVDGVARAVREAV